MRIYIISQWAHTNPCALLLKLGPCCFFRYTRPICMWVLPTTMTMYATWARRERDLCDLQRDRVNEPHFDAVQRKAHTTYMGTSENPMAPPKHTLARSQHGNDLRLWMHQPTPRKAKKKQSATKQKDNPLRTNQALPNYPI